MPGSIFWNAAYGRHQMAECGRCTFYRLAEPPPWSLHFFYKCDKYFTHQAKASSPEIKTANSRCSSLCSAEVLL